MRTLFLGLLTLLGLLIFAPLPLYAADNFQHSDFVYLASDQVINEDYFAAGQKVQVSGTVNGDVYVAGGTVIIDGTVNGDVIATGGTVTITGTVNGNIRAAGGTLNLGAQVGRNVSVAGGTIVIEPSSKIKGSLSSAAGSLQVFGSVDKGVNVTGGDVTLADGIGSRVMAAVGNLTVGSKAVINGDLTFWSSHNASIAKEASISGQVVHNQPPQPTGNQQSARNAFMVFRSVFLAFAFIFQLILGLLLLWLLPNATQKAADIIRGKPLMATLWGLVMVLLTPIVIVVLFLTLIGIPFALLLLFGYSLIVYISGIFTSLTLGQLILRSVHPDSHRMIAFVVGLIVLSFLSIIPILGGVVSFISVLLGVGGLLLTKKEIYSTLRHNKTF